MALLDGWLVCGELGLTETNAPIGVWEVSDSATSMGFLYKLTLLIGVYGFDSWFLYNRTLPTNLEIGGFGRQKRELVRTFLAEAF